MFRSDESNSAHAVINSMRKFSLRSRKSSYTSSQQTGSSATNESHSNSSRPSIADSGRKSSGLSSLSAKLRKSKKQTADSTRDDKLDDNANQSLTLGQRFYELPAEIQTAVFAQLSIEDLLSLRLVSRESLAIIQANATAITRNAFYQQADSFTTARHSHVLIELYPSTFSSTTTDAYFLRTLRREALIRRQLHIMLTFIQTRVYMLKLTRDMECEHFAPYRDGVAKRLYRPIACAQHLLESIRHLVIRSHPTHLLPKFTVAQCPSCIATLKRVISSYPSEDLVSIYQVFQLLLQHFRAATRSPSSVTTFERKIRGWGYGPPPEDHIWQLFIFGGLQELAKLNEMHGSYSKRLTIVKSFTDRIAEAVRINSIGFTDFYQTQTDPVMAMAGGPPPKGKQKVVGIIRKDKDDIRVAVEARADEQPVMKSIDVKLDLLTESMLKSIPPLEAFVIGPSTVLAKMISDLNLVDHERELLSPYGFVQRLMAESYLPEVGANAADDETRSLDLSVAEHDND